MWGHFGGNLGPFGANLGHLEERLIMAMGRKEGPREGRLREGRKEGQRKKVPRTRVGRLEGDVILI